MQRANEQFVIFVGAVATVREKGDGHGDREHRYQCSARHPVRAIDVRFVIRFPRVGHRILDLGHANARLRPFYGSGTFLNSNGTLNSTMRAGVR